MLRRISRAAMGLCGVDAPDDPSVWPAVILLAAVAAYLAWCCFGPV